MDSSEAGAVVLAALEGVSLSREEKACFERYSPAGFTLFRRNLPADFHAIRLLTRDLQVLAVDVPLMISIDQEGGRVARLRGAFPTLGPALNMADGGMDEDALQTIRNHGFVVASSLLGLGINANFAPVLDILSREDNVSIGDRCFAREAEGVSLRAGAFLEGLQQAGVLGCIKHFPGQGHAAYDTHESTARIEVSLEELRARELLPFQRLMAQSPMLMISHAIYPAIDAQRPASLSPLLMQGLLRQELGYQGVIVSDDMNMKAIDQARQPWCEAIVESIAAGADLVLVCREIERYAWAVEAIDRQVKKSPAFAQRWSEARSRVDALRARLRH